MANLLPDWMDANYAPLGTRQRSDLRLHVDNRE